LTTPRSRDEKSAKRFAKRKDAVAYEIRPLSFTEVLDRAFAVVRDQFWLVVGISAVVWIPCGVLLAVAGSNHVVQVVDLLLLLVLEPVAYTALAVAVAGVYLGLPATVSDAYRATRPILASIIGTYLLMYLLFIPLALLLVIPAIYFMVCWLLVAPVMIVEETFGMAALRRSRLLVRGAWWKTFAIMVVVGLIAAIPAAALQVLWAYIPFFGPILNAVTESISHGYSLVAVVVYYFDRRCRTEDFDLRLLAQQIRSEGAAAMPRTSLA
jgi:hypothetical protein